MRGVTTAALLCLSTAAVADVVTGPQKGYADAAEFGEASFTTSYLTPNGFPYAPGLGAGAGVARHAVGWAPRELPVYVETGRDALGGYLLLSTLFGNGDGHFACWTEIVITERGAALRARLDREVARWANNCSPVQTIGAEGVVARWRATRRDIVKALARLNDVGRIRYVPDSPEGLGRMFGLPSFLPQWIDQPVLSAIADWCGVPRAALQQRPGGAFSFHRQVSGAQETSADARKNGCVERAISYLPGFNRD